MDVDCTISLIVAVADNGVIGKGGEIPWRCSSDMQFFKQTTMGKPVIMGRRTWDSLPASFRPLAGRENIVISRNLDFKAKGAWVEPSIKAALQKGRALAGGSENCEIMVIGGKAIYDAYLQQADRIYYTQVHMQPAGDVFFPLLDELVKSGWRRCSARKQGAAAKDQADMTFLQLERVKKP